MGFPMSRDHFRSWEGRCWVDTSPVHVVTNNLPKVRFISYRLLAHYKTAYLNYSVHKTWDYRSKILIQELKCYDADIMCLQDVDLFQEFWYPRLMGMGYDMVFKQRTQEKEYRNEGVLIAFKRDRFQLCRTVALEMNNAILDDSKGSTFRERCRTDDVGLITFLQPNNRQDIPCMLGVATTMLSELAVNSDVRAMHIEYFTQQIELANREFQAPFLIGANLNDVPASPAYTLLRTGRVALSAQVPIACTAVKASPTCRGSALVQWLPPKMTIADSPITTYEIAWRPGGSATLGFTLFRSVVAGDCIHYSEQVDEHGRKKIVADTMLQFTIAGLCSNLVYEFVVRGINVEGPGLWSAPSDPIILPNPEKAPSLPELDAQYFTGMNGVYELRERDAMSESDWNIHLAMKADPTNAPTQLTPRIDDGRINYPIARNRLLPVLDNPRTGWKASLQGIQDPRLTAEISRDYVLGKSILRDKHGYRERSLNDLQYVYNGSSSSNNNTGLVIVDNLHAGTEDTGNIEGGMMQDAVSHHTDTSYEASPQTVVRAEQQLLHQVEEEVSIRMVTDDDYVDESNPAPKQTSLLFTSAPANTSLVPALFKKQRDAELLNTNAVAATITSNISTPLTTDRTPVITSTDDEEMEEIVPATVSKNKRHKPKDKYAKDQIIEVIPFSALTRPVYTTTTANNARLLYHDPQDPSDVQDPGSTVSEEEAAKLRLALNSATAICTFAQLNPMVNPLTHLAPNNAIAKVLDGTSLLLDGKEVLHHIGASNVRHRHGLGLRSAYEICGSSSGEPTFTAIIPKERNTIGTETLDYIFYSQSYGLVACSHLALPSISTMMQSFAMLAGCGETPETAMIIPDWQTSRPPPAFAGDFEDQIQALYMKAYDNLHSHEEDEDDDEDEGFTEEDKIDDDEIDYGYGYSEEKKRQRLAAQKLAKKMMSPEMRRQKMDQHYTPADVQMMKRLLKESLRKSHAIDDQTTEHRPGSTNTSSNNRGQSATKSMDAKGKGKASKLGNNVQYYAAQYRSNNRFWGGNWQTLPVKNPGRNNYFLPNGRFPSSHIAIGADFVINEDVLPALWK